jgi:hypothetical protein
MGLRAGPANMAIALIILFQRAAEAVFLIEMP